MRVLVLGGTQFIGRHIVEALLSAGHTVAVLNRGRSLDELPAEVERLRGDSARDGLSARNRFHGIVTEVKIDGLMAQVEIQVTEPTRVVALVTRAAVEELGLKPGMPGTAIVKATSVMIEG
jgi:molybdopterin-binding protein